MCEISTTTIRVMVQTNILKGCQRKTVIFSRQIQYDKNGSQNGLEFVYSSKIPFNNNLLNEKY